MATELSTVAQGLLLEGATAAHADAASELLARASKYAEDAARELRIMAPVENEPPF